MLCVNYILAAKENPPLKCPFSSSGLQSNSTLLGIYLKKSETLIPKDVCPSVHCSTACSCQGTGAASAPSTGQQEREGAVPIYAGTLLGHETERILAIHHDAAGPGGCYAQWNQSEKGQHRENFIYMWNLSNKTNRQSRKRLIDTKKKQKQKRCFPQDGELQGWVEKVGASGSTGGRL